MAADEKLVKNYKTHCIYIVVAGCKLHHCQPLGVANFQWQAGKKRKGKGGKGKAEENTTEADKKLKLKLEHQRVDGK